MGLFYHFNLHYLLSVTARCVSAKRQHQRQCFCVLVPFLKLFTMENPSRQPESPATVPRELENAGFVLDDTEQSPPLLDSFLEEVGEMKLEIQRLKNRVNVVKAFYCHMRSSKTTEVRRELGEKVNAESEKISASIMKITDTLSKWPKNIGLSRAQSIELEVGVVDFLREVLSEYQQLLKEHREFVLKELQTMLKVTSSKEDPRSTMEKGGSAFVVDQAHLKAIDEIKHIEIEERYAELLSTDRMLRCLGSKCANLLNFPDVTDLAVQHLSRVIDHAQAVELVHLPSKKRKVFLLAGLSSMLVLAMLFFLLL